MAASAADKFLKGVRRFSTTLASPGISNGTVQTATLDSVVNLPTDTGCVITIDRVDSDGALTPSKEESMVGVISGSDITNMVRGFEGTAQAHTAGAVVEVRLLAAQHNRLIDGLLVEHNQDGTHKTPVVTLTGEQTLTNKTLTSPTITTPNTTQGTQAYTPAIGATQDIDLSLAKGIFTVTMPAGVLTLTVSNEAAGKCFMVEIVNATSQGTLTWFSTIKWAGGSAPTLTGTNGKKDTFGFRVTGTDTYDGFIVGQNI